jgi:uncharacterized protein (DUF58 family)
MTAAWLLVATLGFLLFLSAMALQNGTLLALALPYLSFTLIPFWHPARASWRVHRRVEPTQTPGGQPAQITVSVHCEMTDFEEVSIMDRLPAGLQREGETTYHGPLRAGERLSLQFTVRGVRGKYVFSGVDLRIADLLGLREKEEFLPCPAAWMVLPESERLDRIQIFPRRTRIFSGTIRSRESGAGVEFFGTRPYVPGDPLRHLNWKAGARWDLWVTNLFETERVADVGIILDARRSLEIQTRQGSLFEHSIRAAASLSTLFLEAGNRVGLLIFGRWIEWTLPGYGKKQRAKIWLSLAETQLGDHAVFQEFRNLPTYLFPSESQIVLISPLQRQDFLSLRLLKALGYHVLIISPDPIAWERTEVPPDEISRQALHLARMQREVLLAKLRRAHIRVVDWDVNRPLAVVLRETLGGGRPWFAG